MSTVIQRKLEDGILELRLNRPERMNALNEALVGEAIADGDPSPDELLSVSKFSFPPI